ncbi:MAG: adenosine deaminase [Actinomycetota bacterium]|nr:adenosine deaminase [Actinomycetota bacterium]
MSRHADARRRGSWPNESLRPLPKVELHVHLEGSVSAHTAMSLARRHGFDPEAELPLVDGRYPLVFTDFPQFVRLYLAVSRQIRTPDDLASIAAEFARRQADEGVRYTEVTFTALTHVRNGMEPRAMWQALRAGLAEGGPDCEIRLIVDALRNRGPEDAERTVALVADADAPIVGLGLTGREDPANETDFRVLRRAADRLGLGLTVHAGEAGPPASVRAALDELAADRIGHGISAVRDTELLVRLASERVPLEVCPSSNVRLGLVPTLEEHPFAELWRTGVNVTVNSDDPAFFATSLADELAHVARLADLDRSDLAELQRRAARAAFAPADLRRRLLAAIDRWAAGDADVDADPSRRNPTGGP